MIFMRPGFTAKPGLIYLAKSNRKISKIAVT